MEEIKTQYNELLVKANSIESQSKEKCMVYLEKCLEILTNNENMFTERDFHFTNLKLRIKQIKNELTSIDIPELEEKQPKVLTPQKEAPFVFVNAINASDQEIIHNFFQMLLNTAPISYDDYLQFFKLLHVYIPNPSQPVIFDNSTRVYYIGDTHGVYHETQNMIRYFQSVIEKCPDTRIIFDGDYVDRNPYDLENLSLIISFMMLYPNHVRMLRGNHEDHLINGHYGFLKNLNSNFVESQKVEDLYHEILKFFMKLPIGHVEELRVSEEDKNSLDESNLFRIFCCHAGIPIQNETPYEPITIEELQKVKTEVPSFKEFPSLMSWMLWADPREIDGIELHPETGRDFFGHDVFENFMAANNLDLMVRAHEVLRDGYRYFFDKKLISLFSASSYKNMPLGNAKFLKITHPPEVSFLPTESIFLDLDLANVNCQE